MNGKVLINLRKSRDLQGIGAKAENLRRLMDRGFMVPETHVIPWDFHQAYRENPIFTENMIRTELARVLNDGRPYAIRSSANIEDGLDHSFAGQFTSFLDVKGVELIFSCVQSVWKKLSTQSVQTYLERSGLKNNGLKMAVIIQEMVNPCFSGAAFSHNPMTGASEIVVEAVQGNGLQLLHDGATPCRWIYKWGRWIVQPEGSTIPTDVIQQVVKGVEKIERRFKKPIDLEWVYDGEQVYWVQMREISTLRALDVFSNRISREMLPGQIKPLVWSINIPLVVSGWINILTEMVGKNDLQPFDLAHQFYYRAYFNMGAIGQVFNKAGLPSEGLEMMMGIVPKEAGRPAMRVNIDSLGRLPRLVGFFYSKWTFEKEFNKAYPGLKEQVERIDVAAISELGATDTISAIKRHFTLVKQLVYFNINIPLLMTMYIGVFSNLLRKRGVNFAHFDLLEGEEDIKAYFPETWLRDLNFQYKLLSEDMRNSIQSCDFDEFRKLGDIEKFQNAVYDFIRRFGHLSDSSNDFSAVPWREKPEIVLKMVASYIPRDNVKQGHIRFHELPNRTFLVNLFYKRARRFSLLREQIGYLYIFAYGLLREYFKTLGMHLVNHGLLDCWSDIFYLKWEEVERIVEQQGSKDPHPRELVRERKSDMEKCQHMELPAVIYGKEPPPVYASGGTVLRGTPTSQGYYTGPVKTVKGIEDQDKIVKGDILVIPFSDVGWTPLFSKAGAVIAESGGMLSHSSIIAREYKIPAVVSVNNVMQLLVDEQLVSVDGYKGEIIIHDA